MTYWFARFHQDFFPFKQGDWVRYQKKLDDTVIEFSLLCGSATIQFPIDFDSEETPAIFEAVALLDLHPGEINFSRPLLEQLREREFKMEVNQLIPLVDKHDSRNINARILEIDPGNHQILIAFENKQEWFSLTFCESENFEADSSLNHKVWIYDLIFDRFNDNKTREFVTTKSH